MTFLVIGASPWNDLPSDITFTIALGLQAASVS